MSARKRQARAAGKEARVTWLPIVERELRVTARRWRHYGGRMTAAALGLLLSLLVFGNFSYGPPAQVGQAMLFALAWLLWLFCLMAGPRLTADSISAERRENTLGLLFLTDLRGYDIVLGKLAAGSLNSLYGVLAVVPILTLPLLMGGVALDQVGRVVGVLLATLFFSLSAGLFVSCWWENDRWAMGATLLILLLVTGGPFVLMTFPFWGSGPHPAEPNFLLATPSSLLALSLATTPSITGKPDALYGPSVMWTLGWGALFLGGACATLPRVWRGVPRWRPARANALSPQPASSRQVARRRQLLASNPFYWLTSRSRRGPGWVLLIFLLWGVLWAWFTTETELGDDPGWAITSALLSGVLFKAWLVMSAAQHLAEERRSGSMELLLSTPLTVGQIVRGQLRALARRFGAVFLLLLGANLYFWEFARSHVYGDARTLDLMAFCHLIALGFDSVTLALLGMWSALRAKNAAQAAGAAFFRVIVLPGLLFFGFAMLASMISSAWSPPSDSGLVLAFYGLCFVNDFFWANYAGQQLRNRFREAAAQRFTGGGWLRRRRPA